MLLRKYQIDIAAKATEIIKQYGMVYLAMQVRTGKTLTALSVADNLNIRNCLFLTKKKAIASIEHDYRLADRKYAIHVTNYEQLGKFPAGGFDLIVCDEAHCLGAYPKPSLRAKTLKAIVKNTPVIYLSGTPTPEGYSQIFHQLYISNNSPYNRYYNFYTWARDYVKVFEEKRGPYMVKNYSDADAERIKKDIEPIIITYSQEEAGFKCEVIEHINEIDDPVVQQYSRQLFKQRIIETENKKIVADSPATLMSKLHQIGSGTCITDNGTLLLSDKKAVYIKEIFKDMRIAIYYKFVAELDIIKKHFSDITTSPEDFQKGLSSVFVSQIQSGREGIALSTADCIVFYNIDFSAVSYWQARARLQSLERTKPAEIHWLFTNGSIDKKVYAAVTAKKDFTASYFFRHGGI